MERSIVRRMGVPPLRFFYAREDCYVLNICVNKSLFRANAAKYALRGRAMAKAEQRAAGKGRGLIGGPHVKSMRTNAVTGA
jgi:hypothetical protein